MIWFVQSLWSSISRRHVRNTVETFRHFRTLWYRGLEFYSDLSIAMALPIQIVSRVYEPFSQGVVLPLPIARPYKHCRGFVENCYVPRTKKTALILTTAVYFYFNQRYTFWNLLNIFNQIYRAVMLSREEFSVICFKLKHILVRKISFYHFFF